MIFKNIEHTDDEKVGDYVNLGVKYMEEGENFEILKLKLIKVKN